VKHIIHPAGLSGVFTRVSKRGRQQQGWAATIQHHVVYVEPILLRKMAGSNCISNKTAYLVVTSKFLERREAVGQAWRG
jgi:hypothetical protein